MFVCFSFNLTLIQLPNATFRVRIHVGAFRAAVIFRELLHVAESPEHSVLIWCVLVCHDQLPHFLQAEFRTPDACRRHPEQLLGTVFQTRKMRFLTVLFHPFTVRPIRLLYTTIIGYIFSLRIYTIQLKVLNCFDKISFVSLPLLGAPTC